MKQDLDNGAVFVVDTLWGDNGKGSFTFYLSRLLKAVMAVDCGNGSNKQHGFFVNGKYVCVNNFPLTSLNPDLKIRFGSGVTIDPVLFFQEAKRLNLDLSRVGVDPRSPIVSKEDIEWETYTLKSSIGSTFSGTGSCRANWALRKAKIARDCEELKPFLMDTIKDVNNTCEKSVVVCEGAQGTMLSIGIGIQSDGSPEYPNTTSTNVTTVAMADKAGLNWKHIKRVVALIKTYPTREGKGSMGGGREMSFAEIKEKNMVESSSIGGVPRRKAEMTDELIETIAYSIMVNGATEAALTFCDHLDPEIANVKTYRELSRSSKVKNLVKKLENRIKVPITMFNTGKEYNCIVNVDCDKFPVYPDLEKYI